MTNEEKLKRIIGNLETTIVMLKDSCDDNLDSATWRVADAGLLLRELVESGGEYKNVQGVHEPTGMGAILPVKQK